MDAQPAVFVPVQAPWISSGTGPLSSIGRPPLVRFRHAMDGEVVHLSAGIHGHGHALCLRCGRAEPETAPRQGGLDGPPPAAMEGHRRLRGGRNSDWRDHTAGSLCEGNGNAWAIQRYLRLGGSSRTDVLEIRLYEPETGQLVAARTLMTTVAVALRKVATRALGVDERELGYQVADRVEDGRRGLAVLLYDTAAGGAGFCAELPPLLTRLLREAVAACACPKGCDRACHGCLLSNDTQHDLKHLDRSVLVSNEQQQPAILGPAFLEALQLPPKHQIFGDETRTVWGTPQAELLAQIRRRIGTSSETIVRLRVYGEAGSWDPTGWSSRGLVSALHALGPIRVQLVVPDAGLETLDWQQRRQLAGLVEHSGVELYRADPLIDPLKIWAEVFLDGESLGFASDGSLTFDPCWTDRADSDVHVWGPLADPPPLGAPIQPETLIAPLQGGVVEIDLRPVAEGPASGLSSRLWQALEGASPGLLGALQGRGSATEVTYRDRYLKTPQAVHGLYQALLGLRDLGALGGGTAIVVQTLEAHNERRPHRLSHDWSDPGDQRNVIEGLLRSLGCDVDPQLYPPHRLAQTPHHRSLLLRWGGGATLELRLDAGFGFLQPVGADAFPFEGSVDAQISRLLQGSWRTGPRGPHRAPAYLIRSQTSPQTAAPPAEALPPRSSRSTEFLP